MGLMRTLAFLSGQQRNRGRPLSVTQRRLGHRVVEIYRPRSPSRGVILSVHGMSPSGVDDPRMRDLHRGFVCAGFTVVAPRLPSVSDLRIGLGQVDTLQAIMTDLASDASLCPSGRFGIFSVSFSAGLSLLAASRAPTSGHVCAIMTVGTFGDIRTVIGDLLHDPRATSYAWKIVLSNFMTVVDPAMDRCAEALRLSALDEWRTSHGGEPCFEAYVDSLTLQEQELVIKLLRSPGFRALWWQRVLAVSPPFLTQGDVLTLVSGCMAPVTLIHGRDDRTIHATQSRLVFDRLQRSGRGGRLVVTDLISHGDAKLSLSKLRSVPSLVAGFAGWFRELEDESTLLFKMKAVTGAKPAIPV